MSAFFWYWRTLSAMLQQIVMLTVTVSEARANLSRIDEAAVSHEPGVIMGRRRPADSVSQGE